MRSHVRNIFALLGICGVLLMGCGSSAVGLQPARFVVPNTTPTGKPLLTLQVRDNAQDTLLVPTMAPSTGVSTTSIAQYRLARSADGSWGTYTLTASSSSPGGMKDIAVRYDGLFKGCAYSLPPSTVTQGRDANGNVSTLLTTTLSVDLTRRGVPLTCFQNLKTGFASVTVVSHDWADEASVVEAKLCLDATCKA